MKKIILLCVILALYAGSIFSQFSIGPRVGLNATCFHPDYYDDFYNYILGFHAGAYAKMQFSKILGFQPEILYSGKGLTMDESSGTGMNHVDVFITQKLNYLDIPLLMTLGKKFDFLLGVQPSFLLSSTTETETDTNTQKKTDKVSSTDGLNTFDFGVVVGFEHEFKFGLNYGLRVGYGLLNIDKTDVTNIKNFNIQLTLGYSIKLK